MKVNDKSLVRKVKKLTEQKKMTMNEIAKELDCSVSTIKRIRKNNNITQKNYCTNKKYYCMYCHSLVYIKKYDTSRLLCPECYKSYKEGDISV